MINAKTKPCFLLGHPVKHSRSPLFQNAAFKAVGINAVYLALDLDSEEFETVVSGLKRMDILGLNITLPWKREIMDFCDNLSSDAELIRAVNTVTVNDGNWKGHNTDWFGVFMTLKEHAVKPEQSVLLIGAGGATPGVIHGLQKYGIMDVAITNRTMSKAEKLSSHFSIDLVDYSNFSQKLSKYSMIVNCTSIPFSDMVKHFDKRVIYFDLQYYAESVEAAHYIDGSQMLLYQGAKAFGLWTGVNAPIDVMKDALSMNT